MERAATPRKKRKTFTLSPDSLTYPEQLQKRVRNYYGSLSSNEQEENRVWGQFSESQFPTEVKTTRPPRR